MERKFPSLKEVAELAGVSFQTVSKVLNGSAVRVAPETAERIWTAAAQLNYSPNAVARGLVQQATSTIGLVVGDMTDMALARFAVGVDQAARRAGHAILVVNLGLDRSGWARAVRALFEHRVDGIIAAAPELENEEEFGELLRSRVASVSLQHVPGGGVPVVGSSHREVGEIATEHLVRLGHTRIATICGPRDRRVVRSRLHGWQASLRDAGLRSGTELIAEGDWSAESGARCLQQLLERDRSISAVFVHSDLMAVGVLGVASELGVRVPEDLAVVSCDDMPWAGFLSPPLSSVRLPYTETGEEAVELLLKLLRGEEVEPRSVLLPVELMVRRSSGGPRSAQARTRSVPGGRWPSRRGDPDPHGADVAVAPGEVGDRGEP